MLEWLLAHVWALAWMAFTGPAWGLSLYLAARFWRRVGRPVSRRALPVALLALGDLRRAIERLTQQTFYLALGGLALFLPGSGTISTIGLIVTLLLLFPQAIAAYGAILDWQEDRLSEADGAPQGRPPHDG